MSTVVRWMHNNPIEVAFIVSLVSLYDVIGDLYFLSTFSSLPYKLYFFASNLQTNNEAFGIALCDNPTAYIVNQNEENITIANYRFNPSIAYCEPYHTTPTEIIEYNTTEKWVNIISYNEAEFELIGYDYDELLSILESINDDTDAYSTISNLNIDTIFKNALLCWYNNNGCGQCPNECYSFVSSTSTTKIIHDGANSGGGLFNVYETMSFIDCVNFNYNGEGKCQVIESMNVYISWILFGIIFIKECIKICLVLSYFLSTKSQNATIVKLFMNSPILWIVLLCSSRLKQFIISLQNGMFIYFVLSVCLQFFSMLMF